MLMIQLYVSLKPTSQANAVNAIEKLCIAVVCKWMALNRLLVNGSKAKCMIIVSNKQLPKISVDSVTVGDAMIKPVTSLRNLNIWFDQHNERSHWEGKVSSTWSSTLVLGKSGKSEARRTLPPQKQRSVVAPNKCKTFGDWLSSHLDLYCGTF